MCRPRVPLVSPAVTESSNDDDDTVSRQNKCHSLTHSQGTTANMLIERPIPAADVLATAATTLAQLHNVPPPDGFRRCASAV